MMPSFFVISGGIEKNQSVTNPISKIYNTVLGRSQNNSQVEVYSNSQNENHRQGNLLTHHAHSTEHSVL